MSGAGTTSVAARLEALLGADGVATGDRELPIALPIALPGDEAEVAAVLRLAARDGLRVLPVGTGTDVRGADLALSTRRLAGVVSLEPGDGTLTARAGTRMAELERAVAEHGLAVTPAVARPETATLGGVLAAGTSGVDRARFGPARHHVLGMRVALADGTVTRSGGRLVKNVTGFDLHRLYCGSRGTLCVILEATLRLFPAPRATVVLRLATERVDDALDRARALRELHVRPWTVLVDAGQHGRGATLSVVLAGREEAVAWETERAREALPGAELVQGDAARELARALRDGPDEHGGEPDARATCRPSRLAELVRAVAPRAERLRLQPGVAVLEAWTGDAALPDLARPAPSPAAARVAAALRASLDPHGVFASEGG